MFQVLIVVHIMIAIALVGVVLVQRSEGGGLGIGASGGMGSFMTARGTTNLLTRTTGILAAAFMVVSLALALIAGAGRERRPAVPAQPSTPAPPTR
ncbi:MAG: preprotein translocase subunit SecG [Alphaproteobacteria bacterium]